jgi:hypothetical protein
LLCTWMKTCRRGDKACSPNVFLPRPSRAIHVGKTIRDPFLFPTSLPRGSWICLSYCLGNAAPFEIILANLQGECSMISFEDQPLLFRDSVDITRCLGYRFCESTLCASYKAPWRTGWPSRLVWVVYFQTFSHDTGSGGIAR